MSAMFDVDKTKALGRVLLDAIAPQADESFRDWSTRARQWGVANPTHPASIELKRRFFSGQRLDARDFVWFVLWTMNRFPRVLLTSTQADMFMATNAGDDPEVMKYAPWSAYTLELPHDSLRIHDRRTHRLVRRRPSRSSRDRPRQRLRHSRSRIRLCDQRASCVPASRMARRLAYSRARQRRGSRPRARFNRASHRQCRAGNDNRDNVIFPSEK